MRSRIKEVAAELLIRHGYQGLRFQDIADHLETARNNVHFHFATKEVLSEEVIVDCIDESIRRAERIWQSAGSLEDKILGMMESTRELYLQHNPTGSTARPWSLIARMRLDRELITPKARDTLAYFGSVLERLVTQGIEAAIRSQELRADAPVRDIALQLLAIANSAEPITQEGGSFKQLEQLFRGFARLVSRAYGTRNGDRHAHAP